MIQRFIILITLFVLSLPACSSQTQNASGYKDAPAVEIHRFDKALLQWLESGDDAQKKVLTDDYYQMLDLTGKGILNVQTPEREDFFTKLSSYYSEPTLRGLYRDAVSNFENTDDMEKTLGQAFAFLKDVFPQSQIPALYMHVSGFNQNVLVGDSALSLSIDKYLGAEYPLYKEFFPDYDRRKMSKEFAVVDYIAGWLMSEFPFSGKENVLLDQMIYYGKIYYIVSLALPEVSIADILGYTAEDWQWCVDNEKILWKNIITRKHLYTPDNTTTQKYFSNHPCTFLADKAPGNLGIWVGIRIVEKYIGETKASPSALMNAMPEAAQEFLSASKYRP